MYFYNILAVGVGGIVRNNWVCIGGFSQDIEGICMGDRKVIDACFSLFFHGVLHGRVEGIKGVKEVF